MSPLLRCFLLIALAVSLAGCFRQADEHFTEATLESPVNGNAAIPTQPLVDSGSPEATERPQMIITVAATNTPDSASTATPLPTVAPTDTPGQSFITPGSPLGMQIVVTNTPTPGTPEFNTSGGLITPTDFLNTDNTTVTSACEYTVKSGDSLFRIAINNETTVADIKAANDMDSDTIFPGDTLIIPGCGQQITTDAGPDTPETSETAIPDGFQIHIVSSGEVLGAIAERYGVRQSAIIQANNLNNPNSLSVGQRLLIPAPQ